MTLSAFHTHCDFCHGENTAEEMVLKAIDLGCKEIGFTSHAPMDIEQNWCMTKADEKEYKEEIVRLKEKYLNRIKIYLGVEQDYFCPKFPVGYDYVIGSVHYVYKDGNYISLDMSAETLKEAVKEHYNGDSLALAKDYYKTVADVYNKTKCNIVGHIDLITKFEEKEKIFDTSSAEYKKIVLETVDELIKSPVTFEINTGAISRGYRTTPYPEDFILDYIAEKKGRLVITSDTHSISTLLSGMAEVEKSIKDKGYSYFATMEEILKNK